MSDSPRRFSEEEASAILGQVIRRATENSAVREKDLEGLTLEDLQRIASEVGLDPQEVASAAQLIPQGTDDEIFYLSGTPPYASYEIVVAGEVDADKWSPMLHRIREAFGTAGTVIESDTAYEFNTSREQGANVKVTKSHGKTRISVSRSYEVVAFSTLFAICIFGAFASMGLGVYVSSVSNVILGVLSGLILLLSCVGAGRGYLSRNAKKDRKRMKQLILSLGQIASAGRLPVVQSVEVPLEERMQQGT